jgi:tRNA threonylcarbamoyladenosine modification (KEOPS) complex  Pcc1 subunit
MNYSCEYVFKTKDPDKIRRIIDGEAGEKERSSLDIQAKKDRIVFKIAAKDVTALKGGSHQVLKMLQIIEKAQTL